MRGEHRTLNSASPPPSCRLRLVKGRKTQGYGGSWASVTAKEAFWRAVPLWVPRSGYVEPTPALLERVLAGLQQRAAHE